MDRPAAGLSPLIVLGATGSIGTQALEVAVALDLPVTAVAARRGSPELLAIAERLPHARVGVASPTAEEQERFAAALGSRVGFGPEVMEELAVMAGCTVVNGIVGAAGLGPTVAALAAGNRVALANKESLVAGGEVVEAARAAGGGELIPVDSEHSALFQCLLGEDVAAVRRLVLTASGGPFRGRSREELEAVTVAEALSHPTWDMGPRITVDSATLMNKAFEVIEAHHLFGFDYDAIDVVVHPESVVHSMVEFVDGSIKAHLGEPDMRVPISYAITHPTRAPRGPGPFAFAGRSLTFEAPDPDAFPLLELGYEAGRRGGSMPAALNAADEVAVQAFLQGRLGFLGIAAVVGITLERVSFMSPASVAEVIEADAEARAVALELVGSC